MPEKLDWTSAPTVPRPRDLAGRRADPCFEAEGSWCRCRLRRSLRRGGRWRLSRGRRRRAGGDRAPADVGEEAVVGLADDRVEAGRRRVAVEQPGQQRVGDPEHRERPGQQDRRLQHAKLVHLGRADQLAVAVAHRDRRGQGSPPHPVRHRRRHRRAVQSCGRAVQRCRDDRRTPRSPFPSGGAIAVTPRFRVQGGRDDAVRRCAGHLRRRSSSARRGPRHVGDGVADRSAGSRDDSQFSDSRWHASYRRANGRVGAPQRPGLALSARSGPGRGPPFVAVIADDRGSVVVDAGNSPAHGPGGPAGDRAAGSAGAALARLHPPPLGPHLGSRPPGTTSRSIAHTAASRLLEAEARRPWSHRYLRDQVAENPKLGPSFRARALAMPDWDGFEVVPPHRTFEDTLTLPTGVELRHVGGNHAPDSLSWSIPESGVMLLGDCFYPPPFHLRTESDDRPISGWSGGCSPSVTPGTSTPTRRPGAPGAGRDRHRRLRPPTSRLGPR